MIRAAKVVAGTVTDVWMVPALDCFDAQDPLVAAPDEVVAGWTWDGTTFAAPAPDMAALRAAKKAEIERWRDAAAYAPASFGGTTWDADPTSQRLLATAITLATAGAPLPSVWRDAQNNTVTVTGLPQLIGIAGAMAAQVEAAYAHSWALKAEADAAASPSELEEVTW